MKAEILATGDEICNGDVTDTNSAFISQRLFEAGLEVVRHSCVGDDCRTIEAVLKEIAQRADMAVITGGLGPTADDRTAAAAARAAGVELIANQEALESLQIYLRSRRLELSASNRKQALLPAGAACIFNPVGTAPGFIFEINRCTMFFLPGVPGEMRHMLSASVLPEIRRLLGVDRRFFQSAQLVTFGLTEAAVAEKLDSFEKVCPRVRLGLCVAFPEIQVRLGLWEKEADTSDRLTEALAWIRQRLGKRLVSTEGKSMAAVLGDLLRQRQATLAVAESCTGGLISHLVTDVSGSSDYYLFSAVTYSNQSKVKVLGVNPLTIERCGAVHEDTAVEMAAGARRISGATYGVATTGIAGPGGGTPDKPVGTVCIGLAGPSIADSRRFQFSFDNRGMHKKIFAFAALDFLRRSLVET